MALPSPPQPLKKRVVVQSKMTMLGVKFFFMKITWPPGVIGSVLAYEAKGCRIEPCGGRAFLLP
jgi:hypothetical protein